MHLLGSDTRRCLIEIPGRSPTEMTRVHRRLFLTTRGDVREPFEFRIRCGDARTRLHAVDVVTQPAVASLAITLTPPAYTGRALTVVETARQPLKLLVGSQAAVVFQADQEVEAVEVTVDGQAVPGFTWDAAARPHSRRVDGTWYFGVFEPSRLLSQPEQIFCVEMVIVVYTAEKTLKRIKSNLKSIILFLLHGGEKLS